MLDIITMNAPHEAGLLLFCFCLSSCKVGPNFHPPIPPSSKHYLPTPIAQRTIQTSGHAGAAQCFLPDYGLPTSWWRSFRSPKLNRLVCRGLAHSPTLQKRDYDKPINNGKRVWVIYFQHSPLNFQQKETLVPVF